MTRALLVAVALTTLAPAFASAQPFDGAAFRAPVTYQSCSQSYAFACNRRDASGRTYGTAHPRTICTRWQFATDGTVSVQSMGPGTDGRYRIEGDRVFIELLDGEGHVTSRQTLHLDAQRRTLGDLELVEPTPTP